MIAADGVYSVVARRLGINPGWRRTAVALDMMEETPNDVLASVDPDTLWVAYGYGGSEGYSYVFPKRDHVNVGIGYVLDYFRAKVGQSPYDLQASFVSALRDRGVLAGRSSRAHFTPYQIPVAGPLRTTATDRVVAGRRCRRVRERDHRGGHLLCDGHRRPGRPRAGRRRRSGVRAALARRDWR